MAHFENQEDWRSYLLHVKGELPPQVSHWAISDTKEEEEGVYYV